MATKPALDMPDIAKLCLQTKARLGQLVPEGGPFHLLCAFVRSLRSKLTLVLLTWLCIRFPMLSVCCVHYYDFPCFVQFRTHGTHHTSV